MDGASGRVAEDASAAPESPPTDHNRAALLTFVALEIAAFPLLLWWGRNRWFSSGDDWDFLATRTAGNFGDLVRPHFGHWTTVPVLAYRAVWGIWGIRSYAPYLVLAVGAHLAAAALLRAVIRRSGVGPWLATLVAAIFVLFGAGAENVLVAFQVTFVGALVFGLGQLLLADHDGPLDRRDWLALLSGFVSLLFSGVALTMIFVVGLAVLVRRGRRMAAFQTVPLAAIYLIWLATAPNGQPTGNYRSDSATDVVKFIGIGVGSVFGRLGQVPGLGIAVAALLIVGLWLLLRSSDRASLRGRAAAPLAMLVGAVLFLAMTGLLRSGQGGGLIFFKGTGPERARFGRYVYIAVALSLPAIALAAQAVIQRWHRLTIVVVALLAIAIPGNIREFVAFSRVPASLEATRATILQAPRLPLASQLPRSLLVAPDLRIGWLLDSVRAGNIPRPPPLTRDRIATDTIRFALPPAQIEQPTRCAALPEPREMVLDPGEGLTVLSGAITITYLAPDGGRSVPRRLPSGFARSAVAIAGPLRLLLAPAPRAAQTDIVVCGPTPR